MERGGLEAELVPHRRIRVLLLIKELGLGGAERLVVDLAGARDRDGFDYQVAFVLAGQDTLAPELRAAGVPVHDLGASGSSDLRWVPRLRRLLEREDFDVLHAHLPYSAAFGRVAARTLPKRRRPALVYTEHSLWDRTAVLTRALNRATIGLDDALFVVSSSARDALPRALRGRAEVLVHGIVRSRSAALVARRDEVRAAVRGELGVGPDELLVLTVANLRLEKGYDVWLGAAADLRARRVPVRFVSVGWGPLEDNLAAARDAAGLAGWAIFLGRRDDALALMAGADVFVLPSHHEGMPVALMEAMSVGIPVVASDVGGVPDIVTPGVEGLLVDPGRPDLLANAVAELAGDAPLRARLGAGALARSAAFDVSGAARTVEATYRRLVGRTP